MKLVQLDIDAAIATVTLNRPERRNALSLELVHAANPQKTLAKVLIAK